MRLSGRILAALLGLVAALCISGCRTELEPYTPAGAGAPWQPEPVPDLFGDAATGYYVTVGTRMGTHGGRVSEIREQALVIEEFYVTPENEIIAEPLTLPLRRRDGERG